jgi:8-oxo-dGTP diphosphatase
MTKFDPSLFQVALSSSIVVFGFDGEQLLTLIGQKPDEPFKGAPMLPTTWVKPDQSVEDAASNVLTHSLGLSDYYLEQLNAFSKLYRKPQGRVVNIAFYSLIKHDLMLRKPAEGFNWVKLQEIPDLVYDHNQIFDLAKERLKRRVKHRPIGFRLLPQEFSFNQMHALYEQALAKKLDKRNFHKKLMRSKLLLDENKQAKVEGSPKPSHLYAFNAKRYQKLNLKGYDFRF